MVRRCTHLQTIRAVTPSAQGCEECLAIGSDWVHLRLCLTCGHVGCCDSPQPPRDQALPRDRTSDRALVRAGRGLEVVLRRRADDPVTKASSDHTSARAFAPSCCAQLLRQVALATSFPILHFADRAKHGSLLSSFNNRKEVIRCRVGS